MDLTLRQINLILSKYVVFFLNIVSNLKIIRIYYDYFFYLQKKLKL